MKTKNLTKVITGVSAIAAIGGCSDYEEFSTDYFTKQNSSIQNKNAVSISIVLSKEEVSYCQALEKIGVDIIKQPEIAKAFSDNPKKFLQEYGYEGDIYLSDGLLKMILALSDENIRSCVENKDKYKILISLY